MNEGIWLEITINNHPGALSHLVALFTRRRFQLEGLNYPPETTGDRRTVSLFVVPNGQMDQILSQLEKLYDVLSVKLLAS